MSNLLALGHKPTDSVSPSPYPLPLTETHRPGCNTAAQPRRRLVRSPERHERSRTSRPSQTRLASLAATPHQSLWHRQLDHRPPRSRRSRNPHPVSPRTFRSQERTIQADTRRHALDSYYAQLTHVKTRIPPRVCPGLPFCTPRSTLPLTSFQSAHTVEPHLSMVPRRSACDPVRSRSRSRSRRRHSVDPCAAAPLLPLRRTPLHPLHARLRTRLHRSNHPPRRRNGDPRSPRGVPNRCWRARDPRARVGPRDKGGEGAKAGTNEHQ